MASETEQIAVQGPSSTGPEGQSRTGLLRGLLLSAVSGGLIYLTFPPPDIYPLAFVALVPVLFAAVRADTWKRALLFGGTAGGVAYVPLLAWLSSVTIGGWLLLGGYVAVYLAAACILARFFRAKQTWLWPVFFAAAWVGLELIRARFATGFPYLLYGYSQHRSLSLIQLASLTGVYGVSFVLVLVNAAICELWARLNTEERLRPAVLWVIGAVGLVVICAGLGARARRSIETEEGVVVGVVQQNVPRLVEDLITPPEVAAARRRLNEGGDALGAREKEDLQRTIDAYWERRDEEIREEIRLAARLSRRLADRDLDLLVWPETTVQVRLNVAAEMFTDSSAQKLRRWAGDVLKDLARELDCYLLVGAPSTFSRDAGFVSEARYGLDVQHAANSAVLLNRQGEYIDRYDKMHLVPFGEYVPLVNVLPFLKILTPMTRNLTPGRDPVVFEMSGKDGAVARFAAPICYEDVVPELVSRFVRRGADLLVNITDEGWYRYPGELRQHTAMAVFRAVENRTTVVRAANTGISCFIGPSGEIYEQVNRTVDGTVVRRNVAGTAAAPVRMMDAEPWYVRTGDIFALVCLGVSLVVPVALALVGRFRS